MSWCGPASPIDAAALNRCFEPVEKGQRQSYLAWITEPEEVWFLCAGLIMNNLQKGTSVGAGQKINEPASSAKERKCLVNKGLPQVAISGAGFLLHDVPLQNNSYSDHKVV